MECIYDVNQFNTILQNRRSVYPYQFEAGKTIPAAIIWQILENANRAPTHKLTEPWRFTVFTGEGLSRFSKMQSDIYTKYADDHFKEKKLKNLKEYPLMASHVIAIGMKRTTVINIPEAEELIATACAIENIYLTIAAYGLGGYLSTGGITYLPQAKSFFGLQPEDKLIGFFYIGYPGHLPNPLSKRQPVSEKITWVEQ